MARPYFTGTAIKSRRQLITRGMLAVAATTMALATRPAAALLIVPTFTGAITSDPNEASIESAVNSAIGTIDSLYSNPGTVNIVFNEGSGNFVSESNTVDYGYGYSSYTGMLTAVSAAQPLNTVLASAIANLAVGNKPGPGGTVQVTTADAQVVLGTSATGCFSVTGASVGACGTIYDGVVSLNTSLPLNYTTTPASGEYSAITGAEEAINEILGGGGQGSVLNGIPCGGSKLAFPNVGVLDLYRYTAVGIPSFSSCNGTSAYLSVDGGNTSIAAFDDNVNGDLGDFLANGFVQSANPSPGIEPGYTMGSPEFAMMESIGYDGATVPEPASLALLGSALAGMLAVRRRLGRQIQ